jgi:hypothetical protein
MVRLDGWLAHWWGRAIGAGAIAAVAMALYMMVAMAVMQLGFWTFVNVIGATVPAFRPPTAGFDPGAFFAGTGVHLLTGIGWALPYALITWAIAPAIDDDFRPEIVTGLLYGGLVYVVMGRFIGPAIDPAIAFLPMGHYLIAHLIYGVVTALVVAAFAQRSATAVTFAPEVKERTPGRW